MMNYHVNVDIKVTNRYNKYNYNYLEGVILSYKKICKFCGKEFDAKCKDTTVCYEPHTTTCAVCGKEFTFKDRTYFHNTCSRKCSKQLGKINREKTSLERYGVRNAGWTEDSKEKIKFKNLEKFGVEWTFQAESVKQKIKDTNLQRYGVKNPNQSEEIRSKSKKTNMERYGVENPLSKGSPFWDEIKEINLEKYGTIDPGNRPEYLEKRKQTQINKYGKEWYTQTDEYKQKVKETSLEKYGVEHFTQSDEYKENRRKSIYDKYGVYSTSQLDEVKQKLSDSVMDKYGVPWYCMTETCRNAQGDTISNINKKFGEKLSNLGIEFEYEYPIGNKSFDFILPKLNMLVEINPTYTHTSEKTKMGGKDRNYHKEKMKLAMENGFRCINIWDWDDVDLIINNLSLKDKIYARKCDIKEVSISDSKKFLDKYHLQHSCNGILKSYGLFYHDLLISLMVFGKPRYNKNCEWELLRYCTRSEYSVTGGASKLFKHFLDDCNPESVISYCDKSKFGGNIYESLNFNLIDDGQPSKHWSKYSRQITDNLLRQRGFDQLFGTNFGKGTSNEQLMLEHGWLPVYDCGQSTYVWNRGEK